MIRVAAALARWKISLVIGEWLRFKLRKQFPPNISDKGLPEILQQVTLNRPYSDTDQIAKEHDHQPHGENAGRERAHDALPVRPQA